MKTGEGLLVFHLFSFDIWKRFHFVFPVFGLYVFIFWFILFWFLHIDLVSVLWYSIEKHLYSCDIFYLKFLISKNFDAFETHFTTAERRFEIGI